MVNLPMGFTEMMNAMMNRFSLHHLYVTRQVLHTPVLKSRGERETGSVKIVELKKNFKRFKRHETNVKKVKFTLKFVASWKCKWSNGREKLTGPRVQRRESSLHP